MTTDNEPFWLTAANILAIHQEQLAMFGGADGIRDLGLLESALGKPVNRWHYERSDPAILAAAYAAGISGNHPFIDGNKRVAFAALMVFSRMNGIQFAPPQAEATAAMMALAAGELDEMALAQWIANWLGK